MPETFALVRREFRASVRTRTYLLGTLVGPVLIALVFVLPLVFMKVGGNRQVVVVDADGTGLGARVAATLGADDRYRVDLVIPPPARADSVRAALRGRVAAETIDGYLWIGADAARSGEVVYEGRNAASPRDMGDIRRAVTPAVQTERLRDSGVDPAVLSEALRPVEVEALGLRADAPDGPSRAGESMDVAMVVTFGLYMMILLYGMSVLRGVREEKENRVVELVLSSVRPEQLMAGKVIGIGAAGLLQVTIWVAFAALAIGFGDVLAVALGAGLPDIPSIPWSLGAVFLACFLGGYFLYASIYAAVGATATSGQDAQNVQMIATAPLMLAFFAVFAVIDDPAGPVATAGSLLPFTSPLVLPPRIALAPVPAWELAAAFAILAVSCLAFLWIGGKVYKVTILATGQRPSLKQLWRWVRAG
ncbi:MAG: ABC transporter permease [Gemmatimonadetes bacterium]|nr:ABC transporter permease [Gemmatimonadota bacterium]